MPLNRIKYNLRVGFSISHSTEIYDFIFVSAKIGGVDISNPDLLSIAASVELCVETLIQQFACQQFEDEGVINYLSKLNGKDAYDALYNLNFEKQNGLLENNFLKNNIKFPQSFFCIPNGPEPFDGFTGFLIKTKNVESARILLKNYKESIVTEIFVNSNDFMVAWVNFRNDLSVVRRTRHRKNYMEMLINYGEENIFLIDNNYEIIPSKTALSIIAYLVENDLTINQSIDKNNKKIDLLKLKDLNELGWALKTSTLDRWLKTKGVRSGNPDFKKLDESLAKQKSLLSGPTLI